MVKYVGIFYLTTAKNLAKLPVEVANQHISINPVCPVYIRMERLPIDTIDGTLTSEDLEVALSAAHPYPGEDVMNTHFID